MITKQCFNCIHLFMGGTDKSTCLAFPDGVPEPILTGEVDHSLPYEGDHGFRYQPIEEDLDDDGE